MLYSLAMLLVKVLLYHSIYLRIGYSRKKTLYTVVPTFSDSTLISQLTLNDNSAYFTLNYTVISKQIAIALKNKN